MSDIVWIKYRRNTSASAGMWEYKEVTKNDLHDSDNEFATNHLEQPYDNMSEHFRGYEWHQIDKPPQAHLQRVIKRGHEDMEELVASLYRWQMQLGAKK